MTTPLTIVNHDIGRPVIGYMINTIFDKESQEKIVSLQSELGQRLDDIIWNTPASSLHITLMDWIAPLVDYEEDKEVVFDKVFHEYDDVFRGIIKGRKPIAVTFKEAKVFQGAVTLIGQDSGEFDTIRSQFLSEIDLMPGTKQPPKIIHSTVARYTKEADLRPIDEFASRYPIDFTLNIDYFRLVKEEIVPLLQYRILKKYPIGR